MPYLTLLVMLINTLPVSGQGGGEFHGTKSDSEVVVLRDKIRTAIRSRDISKLKPALADDIVWLTPDGEFITKAQVLDGIASGNVQDLSVEPTEGYFKDYGDTVVFFGTATSRNAIEESGSSTQHDTKKTTEVFVKLGGEWTLIAHGATMVIEGIGDPTSKAHQ
ncbi:MAG: nuclear transport factor 2 family protein [Candidatus Sulfotelmatobacter sp.]